MFVSVSRDIGNDSPDVRVYAIMKDHLDDFEKLIKAVLKLL